MRSVRNHQDYLSTREHEDKAFLRFMLLMAAAVLVGLIIALVTDAHGQDASPAPTPAKSVEYKPNPDQAKDLRIAQLEALTAQTLYNAKAATLPEYQQYQLAVQALYAACSKVRVENKWPQEVGCNVNVNPIQFAKGAGETSAATVAPASTGTAAAPTQTTATDSFHGSKQLNTVPKKDKPKK